jgi:antitoxin (DNA-binding transcriptional repressor) of toxin-antitoxin stability system
METTVLQAKSRLSELLRRVERGEEVVIRRGRNGPGFRIVRERRRAARSLEPDPEWKRSIAYRDEDIWASEWKDED